MKEGEDITLISFRGDRNSWQDFVYKVKRNKKQVWQVLEPMLKEYVKGD